MAGLKKIEDKNGYIEADFISAIIIIIMFLIMIIGLSLMQKSEIEITSLKERVNDDIFLMNILRSDQGTGKGMISKI